MLPSDKRGGKAAESRHPTLSQSQRLKDLNLLNPAQHHHKKQHQVSTNVTYTCLHKYRFESPCLCDVLLSQYQRRHLLHLKSIQQSAVVEQAVSCIDFPFILMIIYLLIYLFTFISPLQ